MKKSLWPGDILWAGYLLFLAAFFGVMQHRPMVSLGWQGELPAYIAKLREARRQVQFQGVKTVNLLQARALWETGALFIDARKPEEFAELHIEGAYNLPPDLFKNKDVQLLVGLPKDRRIVVYCGQEACDSALQAAEKLQSQGFTQVAAYLGGFRAWDEAGYPVDTAQ
ncbi:MAG: rhodanese-like domain-containing protein [Deltaproteobacteria bacterium]|nr:rhodanese-like domain-containing protein [Deltaproteobacteria bacterium]